MQFELCYVLDLVNLNLILYAFCTVAIYTGYLLGRAYLSAYLIPLTTSLDFI